MTPTGTTIPGPPPSPERSLSAALAAPATSPLRCYLRRAVDDATRSGRGHVTAVEGARISADLPGAEVGAIVEVMKGSAGGRGPGSERGGDILRAEVIAVRGDHATLSHLERSTDHALAGLRSGSPVAVTRRRLPIKTGAHLLGSVFDATGRILAKADGRALKTSICSGTTGRSCPPLPFARQPISDRLVTGVRAIDIFAPIGVGQRLAVLAPAGTGKSTLLAAVAHGVTAGSPAGGDAIVLALIGERGREVRDLLELELPPLARTLTATVVATSDEPPLRRAHAARTALIIAESLRDEGYRVVLLFDSMTRLARAYRELGLLAGELPVRRGYTTSVFARLPELVERAGATDRGSITALFTVLTTDDGFDDPIAEEVKSLTDGHIVLSPSYARSGTFPAIDPLLSLSRLEGRLHDDEILARVRSYRELVLRYERERELLVLGGTADAELLCGKHLADAYPRFAKQLPSEPSPFDTTVAAFKELERTAGLATAATPEEPASAPRAHLLQRSERTRDDRLRKLRRRPSSPPRRGASRAESSESTGGGSAVDTGTVGEPGLDPPMVNARGAPCRAPEPCEHSGGGNQPCRLPRVADEWIEKETILL